MNDMVVSLSISSILLLIIIGVLVQAFKKRNGLPVTTVTSEEKSKPVDNRNDRLECESCGTVYILGVNAAAITSEEMRDMLGGALIIGGPMEERLQVGHASWTLAILRFCANLSY